VAHGQTYAPSTSTAGTIVYIVSDSINAPGGCTNINAGNALTVTVTINQAPTINVNTAQTSTATCGGINGGVTGLVPSDVTGGTKPYHYQWYNGSTPILNDTTLTLNGVGQGTYSLLVTDAHNCAAFVTGGTGTTTYTVPVLLAPIASFSTNPSPATGQAPLNVIFTNESVSATTYTWTFGDGNSSTLTNPTNTYTNVGTYLAVLTASAAGCPNTSTISVTITVEVPTTIIIPNVFSPNGDGINDQFFIPNTGMANLNCDIFNRWGELLFTITAPDQAWDGRIPNGDKAPDGVYMFILQAQGLNGKEYKQQGTLTLIR
jgi:gliding motility-associated-like protein